MWIFSFLAFSASIKSDRRDRGAGSISASGRFFWQKRRGGAVRAIGSTTDSVDCHTVAVVARYSAYCSRNSCRALRRLQKGPLKHDLF